MLAAPSVWRGGFSQFHVSFVYVKRKIKTVPLLLYKKKRTKIKRRGELFGTTL